MTDQVTTPDPGTAEQVETAVKFVASRGYELEAAQAIVARHGAPAILATAPPAVTVGTGADGRTDYERHSDLLAEVSDHSAPPVGGEQVMHKPEEPVAPAPAGAEG